MSNRDPHPPLQRHPSLQPLSRDHYLGLVHARRMVRAADADDIERRGALAAFLDAWDIEIAAHFDDEERLLAPLAPPAGRERLLREHRELRDLVDEARLRRREIDPGADWLADLGQRLNDHIRWEERELFTAIQN